MKRENNMFKDITMYFISKLMPGILNILTVYILTRMLTLSEYGEYSLVLTVATVTYSFMFEWMRLALLRFYKKFEKKKGDLLGTIAFINIIILICLIILGIILALIDSFLNISKTQSGLLITIIFLVF